jgi:NADH:ubiquinone oxidoreductase subunit E
MPLLAPPPRLEGGALLARLHAIQKEHGHLSQETLSRAALDLSIPLSQLYGAATFYKAFSFHPRGRCAIRVCMGTACHIRGGEKLLENLEATLKVKPEETTADGEFTLEVVHCVGSCSMSPVIQIDGDTKGRLKADRLPGILKRYMPKDEADLEPKGKEA